MQPNENFSFLLDILLLLMSVFFVLWTWYLRRNRQKLLKKYKKDPRYKGINSMLGVRRLIIAILLVLVFAPKTFFDVHNNFDKYGRLAVGDMLSTLIFGFVAFALTLLTIYYAFKKYDILIKP